MPFCRPPAALAQATRALRIETAHLRRAAAYALSEVGATQALTPLRALASDPDIEGRTAGARDRAIQQKDRAPLRARRQRWSLPSGRWPPGCGCHAGPPRPVRAVDGLPGWRALRCPSAAPAGRR